MPRVSVSRGTRVLVDWRRDATVARLTKELLELDRKWRLDGVARAVTLGKMLRSIRDRLPPGTWTVWLDEAVPYTARTAQMYMELERWREAHPEDFMRFRHLGPTKLHLLLSAPAKARKHIRGRVRLRIPGADVLKPIDVMTVRELDAVIRDLAPTPPPTRPIGTVVAAFEKHLSQLEETTDALIARADEIDRDEALALHERLASIVETLETELDL